jgi:tetratricopeptide (TPR) repeat protein
VDYSLQRSVWRVFRIPWLFVDDDLASACAEERICALHSCIADHLMTLPTDDPVRQRELMVHLLASGDDARVAQYYANLEKGPENLAATAAFRQYLIVASEHDRTLPLQYIKRLIRTEGLAEASIHSLFERILKNLANDHDHAIPLELRLETTRLICEILDDQSDNCNLPAMMTLLLMAHGRRATLLGMANYTNEALAEAEVARDHARCALREFEFTVDPLDCFTAIVRFGDCFLAQGRYEEARTAYEEAHSAILPLIQKAQENPSLQHAKAVATSKLASTWLLDNPILSESQYRSALSSLENVRYVDLPRRQVPAVEELAVCHEKVADALAQQMKWLAALDEYELALNFRHQLLARDPESPQLLHVVAISLNKIGHVCTMCQRITQARKTFAEASALVREPLRIDPYNALLRRDLVVSLSYEARCAAEEHEFDVAYDRYAEVLPHAELLAMDSENVGAISDLMWLYWTADGTAAIQRCWSLALTAWGRSSFVDEPAIAIGRRLFPPIKALRELFIAKARLLSGVSVDPPAIQKVCQSLKPKADFVANDAQFMLYAVALQFGSDVLGLLQRPAEAFTVLEEACIWYERLGAANRLQYGLDQQLAACHERIGDIHVQMQAFEQALTGYRHSLERWQSLAEKYGDTPCLRSFAIINRKAADVCLSLRRQDEENYYRASSQKAIGRLREQGEQQLDEDLLKLVHDPV